MFLPLALAAGLWGCAGPRASLPVVGAEERAWLVQLHNLGWQLRGRVGVSGGRDRWHGSLSWEHFRQGDWLTIAGPFGQGGVRIRVREGWIRIYYADGRIRESFQPEKLLGQILGIPVPWEALGYWVLGLPAPGKSKAEYDSLGRLRRLDQHGWQIEYLRYTVVESGALPAKLVLSGPDGVRLKLIVDRWETVVGTGNA